MSDFETGLFLGKIPYVKAGAGPRRVVVFNGGNAFVSRADDAAKTGRHVRQIGKLLPSGCTFYVLGYDAAPPADYSLDMIVQDFAEVMWEIGPASVMGISFGGFVASRLAAEYPELVDDLILMVSAHRFSNEGRRRIARQIEAVRRGDFYGMFMDFAVIFRRPWFTWLMMLKLWRERTRLHGKVADSQAIIRSLGVIFRDDFQRDPEWLSRIQARTMVVGGSRDQFFDVAAYEQTARMIPSARLELFDGETHMLPVERPRAVAKAVAAFLA